MLSPLLGSSAVDANSYVHGQVVDDDPVDSTPNVLDGQVNAITTVGDKVIVGGDFTQVRGAGNPRRFTRDHVLAFDRNTGALDRSFVPVVDDELWTLDAAPDGTSVFVGGSFASVNGTSNSGVAKLNFELTP